MDEIKSFFNDFDSFIETWVRSDEKTNEMFTKLEAITGIDKLNIVKGLLGLFAAYMTFGTFAELICNAVGFIYPAIQSLEALETPDIEDDKKWLTYWIVFAFFSVIEFYSDKIFRVFPVYWLAKLIFLVWAFWPIELNGSVRIYRKIIRPFYLRKKSESDTALAKKKKSEDKVNKKRSKTELPPDNNKQDDGKKQPATDLKKSLSKENVDKLSSTLESEIKKINNPQDDDDD